MDLFGVATIAGLQIADEIVGGPEERSLIAAIDEADLSPFSFQGWLGKRLTRSYGWAYDFDNGGFAETAPIPDWLLPVRDRAANFAELDPGDLVQALIIRYDPGAGIGWHRDRPVFEHVVGISLGSVATMRFRRRTDRGFNRVSVPLQPRSIYLLAGEVRYHWEHSIAPGDTPRWSITFRSLSDRQRQMR